MCSPVIFAVKRRSLSRRRAGSSQASTTIEPQALEQATQTQSAAGSVSEDLIQGLRGSSHQRFDWRKARLANQDQLGFDPQVARSTLTGV